MLREYGIDPALIGLWTASDMDRTLKLCLQISAGRIVSRFPSKWIRHAWDQSSGVSPGARKRLELFIKHIESNMTSRSGYTYSPDFPWLENAETEHIRDKFHKILAPRNPKNNPDVIISTAWNPELLFELALSSANFSIEKSTDAMVAAFGPLLRVAKKIKFVDKNFYPSRPTFTEPLFGLLHSAGENRKHGDLELLEYHVSYDPDFPLKTHNFFATEMPKHIPAGMTVQFVFWEERLQWGLHNRYLLTEIGGFSFGIGLDNSPPGNLISDDVNRLDHQNLTRCLSKFSVNSQLPDIILRHKISITGTRNLP